MAERNIDIGNDAVEAVIQVTRNAGTAGQTNLFAIYAPMTTANLPTLATTDKGSLAFDLTLGKMVVWTGAAWEAITSV